MRRSARAVSALIFISVLVVYLVTLAPTITWAQHGTDGGDFITAAVVWGVPHPPGYPTYTLLGHLFSLFPSGQAAHKLNLMSAVCAAASAALLTAAVFRCAPTRPAAHLAAAIAGWTLAFSPMLWGQATIAEVHALNALFVSLIGYIVLPWSDAPRDLSPAERFALGLVWGVSLGNSLTIAALAPIVLPALWRGARSRWVGLAGLVIGSCVYLLIPIRAQAQPPVNWGDARSLSGLVWLVSGSLYRGYVLSAPLDLVAQRLLSLPRLWLEQMAWIGAIWVGWGIVTFFDVRRIVRLVLTVGLYAVFAVGYHTDDSDLYLLPVWVLSAGYLGLGLAEVLSPYPAAPPGASSRLAPYLNRIGIRRGLTGAVALLGVAAMLIGGWSTHDLSRDRLAADFAEKSLASLPPDAIVVTHSDAHTFTLWYYRLVEGWRRDVSIVDARLTGYAWYDSMLAAQAATPRLPDDRRESGLVDRLALANPDRVICDLPLRTERISCWPPVAANPG